MNIPTRELNFFLSSKDFELKLFDIRTFITLMDLSDIVEYMNYTFGVEITADDLRFFLLKHCIIDLTEYPI